MKIFATKVCMKGRLASFNETRGKSGNGISDPVGASKEALSLSSESESESVRMGSDDWEEASSSPVSSSSPCLCTYVTTGRFRKNSRLSSSNFSKLVCSKKCSFLNELN